MATGLLACGRLVPDCRNNLSGRKRVQKRHHESGFTPNNENVLYRRKAYMFMAKRAKLHPSLVKGRTFEVNEQKRYVPCLFGPGNKPGPAREEFAKCH
jgi:hypothetical protein